MGGSRSGTVWWFVWVLLLLLLLVVVSTSLAAVVDDVRYVVVGAVLGGVWVLGVYDNG